MVVQWVMLRRLMIITYASMHSVGQEFATSHHWFSSSHSERALSRSNHPAMSARHLQVVVRGRYRAQVVIGHHRGIFVTFKLQLYFV